MKTILITLDSLNRHFLSIYGAQEAETPVVDALAKKSFVFDNHFTASAPCMPARRELLTGCLELRHRSWGPLEPFDHTLPRRLQEIGCPSMMVTDHYHYFESGGENYHTDFTGYEFIRGHEHDNWKTFPVEQPETSDKCWSDDANTRSQTTYCSPADYPCGKTFAEAVKWVGENEKTEDFFLYIDEFDPHEPFAVPDEYLTEIDDSGYTGSLLEWPAYGNWSGTEQELRHVRNRYKAKLKFLDDCLGDLFRTLEEKGLFEDTTIILTTDHGHYLGDHGFVGKPICDNFNTLFNIPLVIKPAASLGLCPTGTRIKALSSLPDLFATICDLHGIQTEGTLYARSLLPLMTGERESVRDYLLYGYYGRQLGYCDGSHTFLKSPQDRSSAPLYYYSTRLTCHPGQTKKLVEGFKNSPDRSIGNYIPDVDYPVLKFLLNDGLFPINWDDISPDTLYNLEKDRQQLVPVRDESLLEEYKEKLVEAMEQEKFPQDAFMRLGLISGID